MSWCKEEDTSPQLRVANNTATELAPEPERRPHPTNCERSIDRHDSATFEAAISPSTVSDEEQRRYSIFDGLGPRSESVHFPGSRSRAN